MKLYSIYKNKVALLFIDVFLSLKILHDFLNFLMALIVNSELLYNDYQALRHSLEALV